MDLTKKEAAETLKSAIDTCIWVRLTPSEIQAIVTAHLISKS